MFALVFGSVGVASALVPVQFHIDCFDNNSTATEVCIENVLSDYEHMDRNYKYQIENLEQHNQFVSGLLDYSNQKYNNDTAALKAEVQLWKNKYSYVIAQHGNYSIQDQIANLTDRVTAVETKACLLYTSPSPRDRQKSRMPSSA